MKELQELNNMKSYKALEFFREMNQIPRGSGNEKAVSDWLVKFAKDRNLEVIQDEALNVIIKKPATKGYENAPTVILQGHMDMVCEKNKEVEHDFNKDPIAFIIDGDFLKANGTTLGADNGIAVAYALAILDSDNIQHPNLEVLITTEEETGMGGADSFDPKHLEGRILINIDSEEEGELLVSCAGGVRAKVTIPVEREAAKEGLKVGKITVSGLKGGHSGMEIIKQRGNANKIIGRILMDMNSELCIRIADINGGAKMNAIPRHSEAVIMFNEEDAEKIKTAIEKWNSVLKNELQGADDDVSVEFSEDTWNKEVFTSKTADKVIKAIFMMPDGVQTMSMAINGLVESSLNVGVMTTTEDYVEFDVAVRSSVKSLKRLLMDQLITLSELLGGGIKFESDYPEWQYKADSKIRDIFEKVYEREFGKKAKISAIHAGLECGLISDKFGGEIDQISFGPNIYDVHTPGEHVSISSLERMYIYLLDVLKEIK